MRKLLKESRGAAVVLLAGLVMALVAAPAGATLVISADLGAGVGGAGVQVMSGAESIAAAAEQSFGAANVWNSLLVNSDQQGAQNGATFNGLVDSTGAATGVNMVVTGGIFAWNSGAGLDILTGDYWHAKSPAPGPSIAWELNGLQPSHQYGLWMYGARFTSALAPWTEQGHEATVDLNGDGSLADETMTLIQGAGTMLTVTSDVNGVIHGQAMWHQWLNLEGHWSGFQLTDTIQGPAVPEPSTVVLLVSGLVGLLAYAWRKRK